MSRFACAALLLALFVPRLPAQEAQRPLSRIAFGSCADQNNPCPVWGRIAEQKPELLILLGDTIYADLEGGRLINANPEKIAAAYAKLAALPAFAALRKQCPILATWDDHDYGKNDAGGDYPLRVQSQKLFLDFFNVPADSPRRTRKGVYHSQVFGPPGKRVQVIMLDTRYFRSKLKRAARPLPGTRVVPYVPNTDAGATMLGEEQWAWLGEQLRQPAKLRLIGSSVQAVADEHAFEKWANIPAERERLFKVLRETNAGGVVILSGDRHHGELSLSTDLIGYPLYDLTSSGFNQASKTWRAPEANSHRVAAMPYGDNFGVVTVDWSKPDPVVGLELRGDDGRVALRQTFPLSLLRAKEPPAKLPAGVLTPAEARARVGATATVQFRVRGGRAVSGGKRLLLNSEADYRSAKNFTVVVNEAALAGATFDTYKGKTIRATGTVTKYQGQVEIVVSDAKQIEIVAK
jgi:alkaline phosphatase D